MAGGTGGYVVFATGAKLPMLCSKDLLAWEYCGTVFKSTPKWVTDAVPGVGDLWAPDISYFNGLWHLYYSGSTFGKNRSVIGLATNKTLDQQSADYAWIDQGLVIASSANDNWNAIDPAVAIDAEGKPWLAWGSFWSGIKLRKLDPASGKPSGDSTLLAIAGRPHSPATLFGAIEAPYIVPRGDYYYLFASFDQCCQGLNSSYNIRVGRSTRIDGPYIDRGGVAMASGGGTPVLSGGRRFKGPGHNAIFREKEIDYLVYHAYDTALAGKPVLRIEVLGWDAQGWPIAPSASDPEF